MNKLDEYLSYKYTLEIIEDEEEGGYVAYYPELPGCATTSETMEGVVKNAIEAKELWLKAALADGVKVAKPNTYSGQFKLRLPKSLHRQLAENARLEGVSMNQYCLYKLAQ